MALDLYEHNANAYVAACEMMDKYGKAAIVHPTGTGKSYIAFKLIEAHPNEVIIWLSPSEYIFKTQRESLLRQDQDFPLQNVRFYTYAKLMCSTAEQLNQIAEQNPTYIILDEFHRIGAEFWGESTQKLLSLCPRSKLLGLTATNVRYLDNNRDMAEELFNGHVASEMTLGEAIVRGILPAPKYVTTVFKYQQDLARYQSRVDNLRSPGIQDVNQKYLDALKRALNQADGLDKVFARHITNKSGKYIVFCSGKEHMDEMISHVPEWFAAIDPAPTIYKALSDDPATDKAFAAFKADTSTHLKLLFCIDMLNEGVHVEGISGVILFRPTISPIIYKQQIGRALTAGDSATPLILDVVNNFEGLSSISGLQNEMAAAVQRLYTRIEGESHPGGTLRALIRSGEVAAAVEGAINEHYLKDPKATASDYTGNLVLVKDIVVRYLKGGVMPYDAAHDAFRVEGLEHEVAYGFDFETAAGPRTMKFSGIADRIDRLDDGTLRVVDYKTGTPHLDFDGLDNLFHGTGRQRLSNILQTLLYAMMLYRGQGTDATPALYYVRAMHREDYSPLLVDHHDGLAGAPYSCYAGRFEELVREALAEIYDPGVPFRQCTDPDSCQYCDFNVICKR